MYDKELVKEALTQLLKSAETIEYCCLINYLKTLHFSVKKMVSACHYPSRYPQFSIFNAMNHLNIYVNNA